jgi:hypothetical protein
MEGKISKQQANQGRNQEKPNLNLGPRRDGGAASDEGLRAFGAWKGKFEEGCRFRGNLLQRSKSIIPWESKGEL